MKITIEITSAELAQLVDRLHLKEVPCILDELHEDFLVEPDSETDGKALHPRRTTVGLDSEPKPESDLKPQPKPELDRKKLKTKRGVRRDSKPIDVCDNGEWVYLASIIQAADHIGCSTSQVATALKKGHKCHGHEVRYHEEGNDENILPRGNGHE